ncbi:hypothetical protein RHSIM_Rhsim01G0226700 [Rhododendron simsii]|uniref:Uncharacterized protein n=1 Tax=Rhododendron simsii TaxID=118357 RepID=A0A834HQZ9_RHOSS|nr:hypothetical protein RHSIM_Rhsim01G0226700 [Rhododendron simsii]
MKLHGNDGGQIELDGGGNKQLDDSSGGKIVRMGVVAEIYHLVRRRKEDRRNVGRGGKEISTLFCCKNPDSVETADSLKNPDPKGPEPDLESGTKGFGEEESVESELKRLHNLCGPPRFLFTIKEETREDLESDDGKSRGGDRSRKGSRTRSLGDLVFAIDTPVSLTPLASPKRSYQFEPYEIHGLNPLFESFLEAGFDSPRSSPPPKMKFLRDAEEKHMRRLREEAEKRAKEERDGSFIRITVGKNRETEQHQ